MVLLLTTALLSPNRKIGPSIGTPKYLNVYTYARGTTCIDYVLMDERLAGAIQECGYLPFNQLLLSDHRGLYVDVDITWFFGSDTIPVQPMALRDYTTKNIHQTAPFIT
jgi:hypothetical protein